ncbi:hypothetical protein AVEN_193355-1 [Araneus ventricosus]|uniref:Uncharacterized protein n=1 Tax=Araneus ventricosus TaxID=182803 RepID=A0A4Y2ET69_ARAVE|nr:hypothetical protein AVEN_193355-1 [Araneus ventricosus]
MQRMHIAPDYMDSKLLVARKRYGVFLDCKGVVYKEFLHRTVSPGVKSPVIPELPRPSYSPDLAPCDFFPGEGFAEAATTLEFQRNVARNDEGASRSCVDGCDQTAFTSLLE